MIDVALELDAVSATFLDVFLVLKGWKRLVSFLRVMRGAGAPVDFWAVCLLRAIGC